MKRRIASFWMACLLILTAAALTGCGKDAAQPAAQAAETTEVKNPTEAKPVVVETPAEEAQPEVAA